MKNENILNKKAFNLTCILLLVALNIIIKSMFINYWGLDCDEGATILRAQANYHDFLNLLKVETNQPLFFIVMHFWIKLFGLSEISLRFIPVLFSSLTVIFIYLIGKKFTNNVIITIGAALLFTFSSLNIAHSHDARVYCCMVCFASASMYFYFSLIAAESKRKYFIALTITNLLIIYLHLSGFFLLFLQAFYTLVIPEVRKKIFKEYLISSTILFMAYLPYIIFMLSSAKMTANYMSSVVFPPTLQQVYGFLWYFSNSRENSHIFLLVLLAGIIIALISRGKITIYEKMIFGWFFLTYLIMFAVSIKIRFNVVRFMLFLTPGYYLSIMIAANYLNLINLKVISFFVTVLCLVLMVKDIDIKSTPYNLEASKAAEIVRKHKSNSTMVIVAPEWTKVVFAYHYNFEAVKDYKRMNAILQKENVYGVLKPEDIDALNFNKISDVLLVDGWDGLKIIDPKRKMVNTFIKKFGSIDTLGRFTGYVVTHYGLDKCKNTIK